MKALIVYAHPEPKSFNGAMKDLSVETLRGRGDEVEVTDLYAMRFNAVVAADDFHGERADPEFLSIAAEQTRACERGTLASDIVTEQKKLARAEILILQFPIWWFGMPAILKGWADRVLARGFAYVAGRKYDTGMLRGKTAMIAATTGTSADTYTPDGIDGDINTVLWPVHNGLLRYCGFDVIEPALVQIAGAGKRPVLCCRDFKLGARHSTLQAQVDFGHPDVPVRIVPCGWDASIRCRRS